MSDAYKTKDLSEAAYLLTSGCELHNLENAGNFFYFVFLPLSKAEKLKYEFWGGRALVDPKKYADSIRDLKRMVFSS